MAAKKKSAATAKTADKKKTTKATKATKATGVGAKAPKDVLAALAAVENVRPPEIPVDRLVGEARALVLAARKHGAALAKVGLKGASVALVAGLGASLAAAQSALLSSRRVGRSAAEVKAEEAARDYRARRLDDLEFAVGMDPEAAARISKIREGEGLDDLIADLRQIVTFVQEVPAALTAIGQNPKKLAATGAELEEKLATLVDERRTRSDETRFVAERDRAATALSAAMGAVRRAGRYAFRDEPEKQRLYASAYNRVRRAVARAKQTRAKKQASEA